MCIVKMYSCVCVQFEYLLSATGGPKRMKQMMDSVDSFKSVSIPHMNTSHYFISAQLLTYG